MKDTESKTTEPSEDHSEITGTKLNLTLVKDGFSVEIYGSDIKVTISNEGKKWVTRIYKGENILDVPIPSDSNPWISNDHRDKKIVAALIASGFSKGEAEQLLKKIIIKVDENKDRWLLKSCSEDLEEGLKIQKELEEIKPYREKALDILKTRNPLEYVISAISMCHIGDDPLIAALELSFPALLARGHGNRYIKGPSEKGKSDACDEVGKILPRRIYEPLIGSSAKSKIYAVRAYPKALQNKIFYYDDTRNDDPEFRRLIRVIKDLDPGEEKNYETVIDGKYLKIKITGNCVVWESSVELPEDKQDYSRALICKIDESEEHIKEIDSKCREREGKDTHDSTPEEYLVCKAIHYILLEQNVPGVIVSYWERISGVTGGRANKNFMGLIEGHALLNGFQREKDKNGKVIATELDFEIAKWIFSSFTPKKNLTQSEEKVLDVLPCVEGISELGFNTSLISGMVHLSYSHVSNILRSLDRKGFASYRKDPEGYRQKLWYRFKVVEDEIKLLEEETDGRKGDG